MDPELSETILEIDCHRVLNSDKLTLKTGPKVQAILVGLKCRVDSIYSGLVVGDGEEPV